MTHDITDDSSMLRQRAEIDLCDEPASLDTLSYEQVQRLLHELRVHQIELEMQNTELQQSQEELSALHDRYLDLYDYAPVGYLSMSVAGHILQANLTCASLLGVTRHDLMQQSLSRFIARDGQDSYHFLRQRLLKSDAAQVIDLPMLKANNTKFWARLDIVVAREANTDTMLESPVYRMTLTDITERKRAEEQSAHQTAELTATMASLADGLIVFNSSGGIVRMNDAATQLLGYSPVLHTMSVMEYLQTLQAETLDGRVYPPEELPTARALRGETTKGVIMVLHHPEHMLWVLVSASPILMPDGKQFGAVTTYSDITPIHDLQDQQLLLHLVSHDLRSPLAVISGYASLISDTIAEVGEHEILSSSLSAIQRGVKRMVVMIEDLTEIARIDGGQLQLRCEPIEIASFLQDFLQRPTSTLEVSRVQLDSGTESCTALADVDRLDRIITNLLSNALKYSQASTPILIRLSARPGEVVVSITDQGCGISPDDIPHLFKRFYRASNTRQAEGIGLGLYITKVMVEAHNGCIWVVSEVGQGSTFFFSLPVAQ